jgi:uncharacterized protein YceK
MKNRINGRLKEDLFYFILAMIAIFLLLSSCSTHVYRMSPNVGYVEQDNSGLYICRFDDQGGRICERNLEFYKRNHKRVLIVPAPGDTWE